MRKCRADGRFLLERFGYPLISVQNEVDEMISERMICPNCGQPIEQVYCVWESIQTWVVRRDSEGNIVGVSEKWYGDDELKFIRFQCGCELPKEEWSNLLGQLEVLGS